MEVAAAIGRLSQSTQPLSCALGKKSSAARSVMGERGLISLPFKSLTDFLEHGRTLDEFIDDFPGATREAAVAALEEARSK
jgi:hypothetical protein